MTTLDNITPDIGEGLAARVGAESSPFSQISHIVHEIESIGKKISSLEKQAENAGGELKDLTDRVNAIPEELTKLTSQLDRVPSEIESTAKKVFGEVIDNLAKALSKEGLKEFRSIIKAGKDEADRIKESRSGLVDAINQLSIFGNLGPFTLNWSGFYDRADAILTELDKRIANPPSFHRSEILEMVNALGPDTVNIGASVNFALVIGSRELGGGGGLGDIPLVLFVELADAMMDRLGIPE